jgi:hypothetical protein
MQATSRILMEGYMTNEEGAVGSGNSDTDNSPDVCGGCPVCGGNDGFLNVGRAHWFVCDKHKTKWCVGDNWFRCWRFETEEIWRENARLLAGYRAVPFVTVEPPDTETAEVEMPDDGTH